MMRLSPLLISSALLLAACTHTNNTQEEQTNVPAPTPDATQEETVVVPEEAAQEETVVVPETTEAHVIRMTAENWKFTPSTVVFTQGEDAVIQLEGVTGIHGFKVEDLGINVTINPGEIVDVAIPTDQPGTYAFRCSIPCGFGHQNMKGTIVIE